MAPWHVLYFLSAQQGRVELVQPLQLGHRAALLQVNIMAALRHPNIVLFMGVCLDPPCVVSEWCARGSLYDVLSKARKSAKLAPQLDWTRRLNMALDARPLDLVHVYCSLLSKTRKSSSVVLASWMLRRVQDAVRVRW